MPSDAVLLGGVALAAVGAFVQANYLRWRSQRWEHRRGIANDRRDAYIRYLSAQQAIRDMIEANRKAADKNDAAGHSSGESDDADEPEHDRSHPWAETEVWRESGAAEMNTQLVVWRASLRSSRRV